uniref:Uncharacterized protein n=1 Tax=Ascaris lumbricoides TaxID=6252 RepID=A0A9J2P8R5_ASCLU
MPLFDICCMSSSAGKGSSTPYIPCENKGSDLIEPFFASSSVDLKENCNDYEQSVTKSLKGCNDCVRFNAGSIEPSNSDLCDCLDERSPSDVPKAKFSLIRSMDPLPPFKDSEENLLEKCHSADFKHIADDRKKLQRCEEMTDILIDDYR